MTVLKFLMDFSSDCLSLTQTGSLRDKDEVLQFIPDVAGESSG